jgi:uncharacterized protein
VPQQLTYPGVYIEEVPSGVRTIVGVATSITAFVGRAPRGSVDEAVRISSYDAFVAAFGGLWPGSRLGFAVRDFFRNGGSQAVVARVFTPNTTDDGRTRLDMGTAPTAFTLVASSPGLWGNALRAVVDHDDLDTSPEGRFNLRITDTGTNQAERILAVSLYADDLRRLDHVLERESQLVRLDTPVQDPPTGGGDRPRPDAGTTDAASAKQNDADKLGDAVKTASAGVLEARRKLADAQSAEKAAQQAEAGAAADKQTADGKAKPFAGQSQQQLDDAVKAAQQAKDAADKLPDSDPTKADKVKKAEAALAKATKDRDGAKAATDAVTAAGTALDAAKAAHQARTKDRTDREKELADAEKAHAAAKQVAQDQGSAAATAVAEAFGAKAGNDGTEPSGTDLWNDAEPLLSKVDLFTLLCIPPFRANGADVPPDVYDSAAAFCATRRAMLLVDAPSSWTTADAAVDGFLADPDEVGGRGDVGRNAALFFPRLRQPNPLNGNSVEEFAPCGAVAGVFARTDAARGVWKAPAGLEASLVGVPELSVKLDDDGNGQLNPLGINCLRSFPVVGRVVWGSRTLVGADVLASEWKYVPVRRLALFIEESLFRGTQWVVFEPNDEPLWAQIRLNVGAFMQDLFRQGAFAGASPREAFAVRCDKETTTPLDQQRGVVNILVQFAPLRPAEFVVIRLQQLAGQTGT